jgi:hypothetical protein
MMFIKFESLKGVVVVINVDQIAAVELTASAALIYVSAQRYIYVSREAWDKIEEELHVQDMRAEE